MDSDGAGGEHEMKMEKKASPDWEAWIRMSPDVQSGVVRISIPGRRKTGGKGKDSKGKKVVQGRVAKKGKA